MICFNIINRDGHAVGVIRPASAAPDYSGFVALVQPGQIVEPGLDMTGKLVGCRQARAARQPQDAKRPRGLWDGHGQHGNLTGIANGEDHRMRQHGQRVGFLEVVLDRQQRAAGIADGGSPSRALL